MSKEGLQTLFPMEEISVMGLWELLPHLNTIRVNSSVILYMLYLPYEIFDQSFEVYVSEEVEGNHRSCYSFSTTCCNYC